MHHVVTERGQATDPAAAPAPFMGLPLSANRLVASAILALISDQFSADCTWRPAKFPGDCAPRYSACMQAEYRTSLVFREAFILCSHCNFRLYTVLHFVCERA